MKDNMKWVQCFEIKANNSTECVMQDTPNFSCIFWSGGPSSERAGHVKTKTFGQTNNF